MQKISVVELFAGVGGFRLGLEKIGFKYIEEAQVFSKSRQENVHCLDYEYILY